MLAAREKDIDKIILYLKKNVQDCIYMYIDIKKYRLNNPAMKVWVTKDYNDQINFVVMQYHTSISLFSADDEIPEKELVNLIAQSNPNSITGKRRLIEKLHTFLTSEYYAVYGFIFKFEKFHNFGGYGLIEKAGEADALEIAKLVTSDNDIGSYYEIEDFAHQLQERMQTHMGRSYIIRDAGKIIGHIATYAELDNIATTSGLKVNPAYEGHMLGAVLESYIVHQMLEEGFNLYTYVTSKKRYKLLKNMGNPVVGEYGKMIKIKA